MLVATTISLPHIHNTHLTKQNVTKTRDVVAESTGLLTEKEIAKLGLVSGIACEARVKVKDYPSSSTSVEDLVITLHYMQTARLVKLFYCGTVAIPPSDSTRLF